MNDDVLFVKVPYGFVDIYGIKWEDSQVDLYNKISAEINQRAQNKFLILEKMLSDRHAIYNIPFYNRKKDEVDAKKCRRRNVFVVFENGTTLETAINGTKDEIRNYYLNNRFNVTSYREDGKGDSLTSGKSVIFTQ